MKKRIMTIMAALILILAVLPVMTTRVEAKGETKNLFLEASAKGKTELKLSWNQVSGADKYVVYGAKCGKKFEKIATVKKGTTYTVKKIGKTKLKAHTSYKLYVVAYSKGKKIIKSNVPHVITTNTVGEYGNVKKISVKKKSITLKEGKSATIKPVVKTYGNKKHLPKGHGAATKFYSADKSVAIVSSKGKVKGIKEGTTTIYVQDMSGKKCTVTVKVKGTATPTDKPTPTPTDKPTPTPTPEPIQYTVRFDLQGHGGAIDDVKVNAGEKVKEPKTPTDDELAFFGWFKEKECKTAWKFDTDVVEQNMTLYAKWDLNYLCFKAEQDGSSVSIKKEGGAPSVNLEYTKDDIVWSSFVVDETIIDLNNGESAWVRAADDAGNQVMASDYSAYNYFVMAGKVASSGNVMSLLDKNCEQTSLQDCDFAFYGLFMGCESLTSAPILPATTLSTRCYNRMFYSCINLTKAPALPADVMKMECYGNMFYQCTNLVECPDLPASTLDIGCYYNMFGKCKNLTKTPELSAEILKDSCYKSMFAGCTSLTEAPALPSKTLAVGCYISMFQGCTKLAVPPALSAEVLTTHCYENMFAGCTNLTEAPALPSKTLATNCYYAMFSNCTNLTKAPSLPAEVLAQYCYAYMFKGCSKLTSAPTLPAMQMAMCCYEEMFSGCASLMSAPTLPAITLAFSCYKGMFKNCTSISSAPSLSVTTLVGLCYESMFENCTNLTEIPTLALSPTLATNCYKSMFKNTGIRISSSQVDEYSISFMLTYTGTFPNAPLQDMFAGTSGSVTSVTANTEYYAAPTQSVTYDLNGKGDSIVKNVASGGKIINKPADPEATGFTFVGWYKEANGTNAWNFDSDKVTDNITLYAKWE